MCCGMLVRFYCLQSGALHIFPDQMLSLRVEIGPVRICHILVRSLCKGLQEHSQNDRRGQGQRISWRKTFGSIRAMGSIWNVRVHEILTIHLFY